MAMKAFFIISGVLILLYTLDLKLDLKSFFATENVSDVNQQVTSSENVEEIEKIESALNVNIQNNRKRIPAPCGDGGLKIRDIVAVSGDSEVRYDPSASAQRKRNKKASEILGGDHFHHIDNSTTVRRLCVQSEWTQIQIVTPEWLTFVRGWVPNQALREIERAENGRRVYVDDDFYWDDDTSVFKSQIINVVNKISQENTNCRQLDTASMALSPTRSTPNNPVFFITCGYGANAFNVWFKPEDANSEQSFKAIQPIGKIAATDTCEQAAKLAAIHPSTVEFSRVWDLAYMPHASGRARIISTFTAKNRVNLELK